MGSAKEAMLQEEDRLRLVEHENEVQADLLDREYEWKSAEKAAIKNNGKVYWTVSDADVAYRLGIFQHTVQESDIGDYLKVTQFIYNNLAQLLDPSESMFDVTLPIFHSVFQEEVEAKCKSNFYPDDYEFIFGNMDETEDENGLRLVNPEYENVEEKNMVVQTNDEYDNDQVLISQQATEIAKLTKELLELKK